MSLVDVAVAAADSVEITVSRHAVSRYAERFASAWPDLIEVEIRECLRAGRVSTTKPRGVLFADDPDCLYVWTETGERVYVLTPNRLDDYRSFAVKTTLRIRG